MSYNKYMCTLCGYIYDEELGCPEDGIPAGTLWKDVPEDWVCPECGAMKIDFELIQEAKNIRAQVRFNNNKNYDANK